MGRSARWRGGNLCGYDENEWNVRNGGGGDELEVVRFNTFLSRSGTTQLEWKSPRGSLVHKVGLSTSWTVVYWAPPSTHPT